MMKGAWLAFLAASCIALSLALAGCQGNQYVPCCERALIYNEIAKALLDNPDCRMTGKSTAFYPDCIKNEDLYDQGLVLCKMDECEDIGEYEACSQSGCVWRDGDCGTVLCSDLKSESECAAAQCTWVPATEKCTGDNAYVQIPICLDQYPKSCINNKCTAMMCGFKDMAPAPPIASSDWASYEEGKEGDVQKTDQDISMNLFKTSCDFSTMNKKLFNQVKRSKGALWVNSFRFGIGSSFSDYEAARYSFPSSDRFCNPLSEGTVDRFVNYLNAPATYCRKASLDHIRVWYCDKNGQYFVDRDVCEDLYCQGAACVDKGTNMNRYACNSDKFAYANEEECYERCGFVSSEDDCTADPADYPFLVDDGKYKVKLVADYIVDANRPWINDDKERRSDRAGEVCKEKLVYYPDHSADYGGWLCECAGCDNRCGVHSNCRDYYYGANQGFDIYDGPWRSDNNNLLNSYFTTHRTVATDFDYEYYENELGEQYDYDSDEQLIFECGSGGECISGVCDKSKHTRTLFKDGPGPSDNVNAYCTAETDSYGLPYFDCTPSMSAAQENGMYLTLIDWGQSNPNLPRSYENPNNRAVTKTTSGRLFDRDGRIDGGGEHVYQYFVKPAITTDGDGNHLSYNWTDNSFITKCNLDDNAHKVCACDKGLYTDDSGNELGYKIAIVGDLPTNGLCQKECTFSLNGNTIKYYSTPLLELPGIDFDAIPTPAQWGSCRVKSASRPFLEHTVYGWCESCSYATMAVQTVGWGLGVGGYWDSGISKDYSCYEWRGEYDYAPKETNASIGMGVNGYYGATKQTNNPSSASYKYASADDVRKEKRGNSQDGNIESGDWKGSGAGYKCVDGWSKGRMGWWERDYLMNPSPAYLREKLKSYLSSNIMPILNVTRIPNSVRTDIVKLPQRHCGGETSDPTCTSTADCQTYLGPCVFGTDTCSGNSNMYCYTDSDCVVGPYCQDVYGPVTTNVYHPIEICNEYDGDGAVVYAVGDTGMVGDSDFYGWTIKDDNISDEQWIYMGLGGPGEVQTNGDQSILIRALFMKQFCPTQPMVGLAVNSLGEVSNLIGSEDSPGPLHKFFYDPNSDNYGWRVANGKPDELPDNIDMFLVTWTPSCNPPTEDYQADSRKEFKEMLNTVSKLTSTFSKPTLIWKFHMKNGNNCHPSGEPNNYSYFMNYTFDHLGEMVDAGVIGIIYDSWITSNGTPYGPKQVWAASSAYNGYIRYGLSTNLAEGRLDNPIVAGVVGKSATPFCSLQKYSSKAMGFSQVTFGQKYYAEASYLEGGSCTCAQCACEPCSDEDYAFKDCDPLAGDNIVLPQHICLDGKACTMPGDPTPPYNNEYRCAEDCMRYTGLECESACPLTCAPCETSTETEFCRIDYPEKPPEVFTFEQSKTTDLYWDRVAALPNAEKCCLTSTREGEVNKRYTYVERTSVKQNVEFIQYPTRAEEDIDCGRMPDTSVLKYCGIDIPINEFKIDCEIIPP